MKKYILLLLSFLFINCAHPIFYDPLGNCKNRAVYCALEASEKYEAIIVTGTTKVFYIYHAQAKVKINNEWQWLTMIGEYCYIADQDEFTPLNEWRIQDFIKYYHRR